LQRPVPRRLCVDRHGRAGGDLMTDPHDSIVTPASDAAPSELGEPAFPVENWVAALRIVADYYGLPMSTQAATLAGLWDDSEDGQEQLRNLARRLGLRIRFDDAQAFDLAASAWRLPLVLELRDGQLVVVRALDGQGGAQCVLIGDGGLETTLPIADMTDGLRQVAVLRPMRQAPDPRVDSYIEPFDSHWLLRIVLPDLRPYGHLMLASLVANIMTLSSIIFSMQVYYRVVPSGSYP